jgi:glutathione synthase
MSSPSKNILFISDPIAGFDPEAETTSFLMLEAASRGYAVFQAGIEEIYYSEQVLYSRARRLAIEKNGKRFSIAADEPTVLPLDCYRLVLLRKDPPVDERYIRHLELLSLWEEKADTRFINCPSGILLASEKLLPLHLPHLCPPTAVTCDPHVFTEFLNTHGDIILKPLNLSGGRGIFRLSATDRAGALACFERQSAGFKDYQVLQRFIPEASAGDKRILLCASRVLGTFLRVPKAGDFRGNMHQGATWHKTGLTARDEEIIRDVLPLLERLGLLFVGIDVIGGYVTEINSTSPMGIREIDALYGKEIERECFDIFESLL